MVTKKFGGVDSQLNEEIKEGLLKSLGDQKLNKEDQHEHEVQLISQSLVLHLSLMLIETYTSLLMDPKHQVYPKA